MRRGAADRQPLFFVLIEPGCKPDSVVDGHLSAIAVAGRPGATYPERGGRAALLLLGLAPDGVYLATSVTRRAGGLLPHRFTLACGSVSVAHRRSALCCTVHRVAPPGCYPASCPVESGLSSIGYPIATVSPARSQNGSARRAWCASGISAAISDRAADWSDDGRGRAEHEQPHDRDGTAGHGHEGHHEEQPHCCDPSAEPGVGE